VRFNDYSFSGGYIDANNSILPAIRFLGDQSTHLQLGGGGVPLATLTTSGTMGIGTMAPVATLHVNSSQGNGSFIVQNTTGSTHLFVNGSSGRVGVGTAAPTDALDVVGGISSSGDLYVGGSSLTLPTANIYMGGSLTGYGAADNIDVWIRHSAARFDVEGSFVVLDDAAGGFVGVGTIAPTASLTVNGSNSSGSLFVYNSSGSTHLFVNGSSGYVGIGTAAPNQQLSVNGNTNVSGSAYVTNNYYAYGNIPVLNFQNYFCDFLVNQSTTMCYPYFYGQPVGAGTSATIPANTSRPGVVSISDAAAANTGYRYMTENKSVLLNGSEIFRASFKLVTNQLQNTSVVRVGFIDTYGVNSDCVNGVYFEIVNLSLAGKLATSSARNATGTNLTLANMSWYEVKIVINSSGNGANFLVYNSTGNVYNQTLTQLIPTAAGAETGAGIIAGSNTTGTATIIAWVDYLNFEMTNSRRFP
jgi:hypothetical protein